MLAVGRKLYPDADFRLGDMRRLSDVVSEICDGFWCVAAFMQVPRSHALQTLKSMRAVLRPNGIGFLSTPDGERTGVITHENHPRSIPEGHQALLNQWTIDALEPLFTEAGLKIIDPTLQEDGLNLITLRAV
jgi:hypothetical protein